MASPSGPPIFVMICILYLRFAIVYSAPTATWRPIFKLNAGITDYGSSQNPGSYYQNGLAATFTSLTDEETYIDSMTLAAETSNFKSLLIDKWEQGTIIVNEVKLSFGKNGYEEAFVIFDAYSPVTSTWKKWLAQDNIVSSSWEDITTASMSGGDQGIIMMDEFRYFGMIQDSNGCESMYAWFIVSSTSEYSMNPPDSCDVWNENYADPSIRFATDDVYRKMKWHAYADTMVIYVDYFLAPTKQPTTKAPTTKSPTSTSPTTKAPTTKTPTTKTPTTKAPTTRAPTSAEFEVKVACDDYIDGVYYSITGDVNDYILVPRSTSGKSYPITQWYQYHTFEIPSAVRTNNGRIKFDCRNKAKVASIKAGLSVKVWDSIQNTWIQSNNANLDYFRLVSTTGTSTSVVVPFSYQSTGDYIWTCGVNDDWSCGTGVRNEFEFSFQPWSTISDIPPPKIIGTTQGDHDYGKSYCEDLGFELISFHSQTEFDEADQVIQNYDEDGIYIIGLRFTNQEWQWTDGTNMDYGFSNNDGSQPISDGSQGWYSGQPDNNANEPCGEWNGNWDAWNDIRCYRTGYPLCAGNIYN